MLSPVKSPLISVLLEDRTTVELKRRLLESVGQRVIRLIVEKYNSRGSQLRIRWSYFAALSDFPHTVYKIVKRLEESVLRLTVIDLHPFPSECV